MAQRDGFHFLAIGKDDDAPLSQTHMEARILENLGNGMNKKQFQIVPGVDQLGLTLVTRAINEIRGDKLRSLSTFCSWDRRQHRSLVYR